MTKWFDINGLEITEQQALRLDVQEEFFVDWEDESIPTAQCFKTAEDWWTVRAKVSGKFYPRGRVRSDGQWFYPEDKIHSREQHFTSAALALVRH